ncbi:hypothetical protein B0A48_06895 [Cryoendolithus antarcticus]|uniref:GH16 domain-containing protein n=1 Tax=Cryoendolithus antarcticus TaxID=1507870 RepID=A0A1V8TA14_9PEZI|nr:hypothetical protein B0A48_06895 [Cryoendolithus antarcticus]
MPSRTFRASSALISIAALATTGLAASTTSSTNITASTYKLIADLSGPSFFSNFNSYAGPDPTNGFVNYLSATAAASSNLTGFFSYPEAGNLTTAFIRVDTLTSNPPAPGRASVRLSSKQTFNVGTLVVADIYHMPTGFGTWPALWMLGGGAIWPAAGEIDIIESVHNSSANIMTLHTAPGCSVDNSTSFALGGGDAGTYASQLMNENCNTGNGADGCSNHGPAQTKVYSNQLSTAGEAFNEQEGGVYVTEWTTSGVKIWAFARDAVPSTLNTANPSTVGFPTPLASFSGKGCDFGTAFKNMTIIINTTFCGDWAGKVWESSGAKAATGVETCEAFVAGKPDEFVEAYWEVGGIRVYSGGSQ